MLVKEISTLRTVMAEHRQQTAKLKNNLLRIFLIVGVIGIGWYQFAKVPYEAVFRKNSYQSWSFDLPRQSIWQSPATPDFKSFVETFDVLPSEQPARSIIYVVCHWEIPLFKTMLFTYLYLFPFSWIYHITRNDSFDFILHFAYWLAITWTCCAVICLCTGMAGPPAALAIGCLGLFLGLIIGLVKLDIATNLFCKHKPLKRPQLPVDFSMFEGQTSSNSASISESQS
jgi:hypothetical protein